MGRFLQATSMGHDPTRGLGWGGFQITAGRVEAGQEVWTIQLRWILNHSASERRNVPKTYLLIGHTPCGYLDTYPSM